MVSRLCNHCCCEGAARLKTTKLKERWFRLMSERLTGRKLLDKLKELENNPSLERDKEGNIIRREQARGCGYVGIRHDGKEKICFTDFWEAHSSAKHTAEMADNGSFWWSKEDDSFKDNLPSEWKEIIFLDELKYKLKEEVVDSEILCLFSKSDDRDLRYTVALNKNITKEIHDNLKKDDSSYVKSAIIRRCLPSEYWDIDETDLSKQIKEGLFASDLLEALREDKSYVIQEAISLSPQTSKDTLFKLLENKNKNISSIVSEKLLPQEWKDLDTEERINKIRENKPDKNVLNLLQKVANWKIKYIISHLIKGEDLPVDFNNNEAFAFRCLEAFDSDCDLILGDESTLILSRSGATSDENYTISLQRVEEDDDGDIDYETINDFSNTIQDLHSAIEEYLEEGGSLTTIEASLQDN